MHEELGVDRGRGRCSVAHHRGAGDALVHPLDVGRNDRVRPARWLAVLLADAVDDDHADVGDLSREGELGELVGRRIGRQRGDEHIDWAHDGAVFERDRRLARHAAAHQGQVGIDALLGHAHLEVDVAQAFVAELLGQQARQRRDLFVVVADNRSAPPGLGELVPLTAAEDLDALVLAVLEEQRRLGAVGVVRLLRPDL